MRTLILFALLSTLILSACGAVNLDNAYVEPQNLTPEWTAMQEDILERNLAILEEEPSTMDAIQEVAFRYQSLGEFTKAVAYYEQLLELNVTHFVALNNLANIYEMAEEYETAAEYLQTLYQGNQSNYNVLKDVVRVHLKADDAENAQMAIDNYVMLVLSPDNPSEEETVLVQSLNDMVNEYLKNN